MWKRSSFVWVLIAAVAMTSSCILDPDDGGGVVPPTDDQKFISPAKNRSDVLNNIEYCYNKRNIERYDQTLDQGFIFFLSDGDVNGGLPVQWDRQEELELNGRLFSRDPGPDFPRATRVELDLQTDNGVVWGAVIPETAPDEIWFTTTVFYDFTIEVEPDTKYIPAPGAKGQFTVRNVGTEEAPNWKLVEFRDLGGAN